VSFLSSETGMLEIAISLVRAMKHGKVSVQAQGEESLRVEAEDHKISLNFLQEEKLRDLLTLGAKAGKASSSNFMDTFRNTAEKLKQDGLTLAIYLNGKPLITMGSEAHGAFSKIFTGTDCIEINNFADIIRILV
jgi:hypothetical protein